jgi:hypothetical protein
VLTLIFGQILLKTLSDPNFAKFVLEEGASIPVNCDVENMKLPDWADEKKIKR